MADSAELRNLTSKDVRTWSVADVAKYVDLNGLGEYRIAFVENDVSGSEFVELTQEELQALGVKKLGHRKQIMQIIKRVRNVGVDGASSTSDSVSDSGSAMSSSHGTSVSAQHEVKHVTFKAKWEGKWIAISADVSIELRELKKKLRRETRMKVDISYNDADGDEIQITRRHHLRAAVDEAVAAGKPVRLTLKEEGGKKKKEKKKGKGGGDDFEATTVSSTEAALFEGMSESVIVIEEFGRVIFFNKAASLLFRAAPTQVLGQNIKVLMLDRDAESHDFYLWRYSQGKETSIVGQPGRMVVARRFDGSTVHVHLAVNKAQASNGKTIFVGTLHEAKTAASETMDTSRYALMDMLLQGAVVISPTGIVAYANKPFLNKLGYAPNEVIGKNVSMLMPDPHRSQHDNYLRKYAETGEGKIIGKGRVVPVVKKDGSSFESFLTVNPQGQGDDLQYIGVFDLESKPSSERNVLAEQRALIDTLPLPSVVIDDKGLIQAFNAKSETLFGFSTTETLGRNVRMLMPEPDKSKHDGYLRSYMRRGAAAKANSSVVGAGRDVIAQHKDGHMMPVHLSVTEYARDGGSIFTGIIVPK